MGFGPWLQETFLSVFVGYIYVPNFILAALFYGEKSDFDASPALIGYFDVACYSSELALNLLHHVIL